MMIRTSRAEYTEKNHAVYLYNTHNLLTYFEYWGTIIKYIDNLLKVVIFINKIRYFFNDIFSITNYKNGRILSDVVTSESYYVDEKVFKIIEPATNNFVTFEDLYDSNYSHEEFESFIQDLINKKIFIIEWKLIYQNIHSYFFWKKIIVNKVL